MKTIQFLNKKYDIPTEWSDITLKMQMEVSQVAHEQKHVKTLGILAGYTGIAVADLKSAKVKDLERVMKHLAFISTPIPDKPIMNFNYNGNDYIIPPNILEQEFQDYVAIQTAIAEYGDNQWLVTPFILAVMCKRNDGDETLDDFDINERAEEFEDIPVSIANGVAGFFLNNSLAYKSIMMSSSPEVLHATVHAKTKELNLSLSQLRKQRGGNLLIRLWVMISRKYIKSLNKRLEKYYNSQQSKPSKKKWMLTCNTSLLKMRKEKVKKT